MNTCLKRRFLQARLGLVTTFCLIFFFAVFAPWFLLMVSQGDPLYFFAVLDRNIMGPTTPYFLMVLVATPLLVAIACFVMPPVLFKDDELNQSNFFFQFFR
jgi:hypothetical protein